MNKIAISVVAGLALFGNATLAAAQGHDRDRGGRGGGGGGGGHRAAPPAARPAPQVHRAPAPQIHRAPQARTAPAPQARRQVVAPRVHTPRPSREAQSPDRGRRAAEQRQRAERPRADQRRQAAERQKAVTDKRATADRERAQRQTQTSPRSRPDQAERPRADAKAETRSARHDELRREHQKLSAEQRTRLRGAFDRGRGRVSNVRFAHRIGTHIPRRVRLFAVPAAVLSIFPYYSDYRYVVMDDTVCIVDPVTYEVVDVIDEGPYPAPSSGQQIAQLTLSTEERAMVLDSIPVDFPIADVRLRLALGAEIPPQVELHQFAPIVLDSVPRLRDFRFVVAQGAVVIVDPRDRSTALFLDR
jgi:Protein of unknown function (DUF1236)